MSKEAYSSQAKLIRCNYCGKILRGYYFICHVCGKTYCYTHMPEKCNHLK